MAIFQSYESWFRHFTDLLLFTFTPTYIAIMAYLYPIVTTVCVL